MAKNTDDLFRRLSDRERAPRRCRIRNPRGVEADRSQSESREASFLSTDPKHGPGREQLCSIITPDRSTLKIAASRRVQTHAGRHVAPENASIDRGRASNFEPDVNSPPARDCGAVSSSMLQRVYSGSTGSVNSIVSFAALNTR